MCGGTFFAIPYLGLSVGLIPSLAIGITAFGAGELIFRTSNKKQLKEENKSLYDTLIEAKNKNMQIKKMTALIEDNEIVRNINEIHETVNKIISTIEKKPEKYKKMNNFFEYYLPVTVNILSKYDEIENQRLTTVDSKEFMKSTKNMVEKINQAFKKQLSNLYQSDMIDTDAEIKVFDSMLKSDGYYGESDFSKKENL